MTLPREVKGAKKNKLYRNCKKLKNGKTTKNRSKQTSSNQKMLLLSKNIVWLFTPIFHPFIMQFGRLFSVALSLIFLIDNLLVIYPVNTIAKYSWLYECHTIFESLSSHCQQHFFALFFTVLSSFCYFLLLLAVVSSFSDLLLRFVVIL